MASCRWMESHDSPFETISKDATEISLCRPCRHTRHSTSIDRLRSFAFLPSIKTPKPDRNFLVPDRAVLFLDSQSCPYLRLIAHIDQKPPRHPRSGAEKLARGQGDIGYWAGSAVSGSLPSQTSPPPRPREV